VRQTVSICLMLWASSVYILLSMYFPPHVAGAEPGDREALGAPVGRHASFPLFSEHSEGIIPRFVTSVSTHCRR